MSDESLPSNWVTCTLADIGKIVSGGTPSTEVPDYWGNDVRWISPSDLTGYKAKFIARGAKSLSALGLDNCSAKLMPAGSVHFSSRAPIGYVVISAESLCTNQGFKSLVLGDGVFNEYVYFYLKSIKALANSLATGTTFKELSGSAFAKLPFPLPPLAEQKRIVAKIEELFSELEAGEESLRVARRQLGVYRQSLLKQAFEGKLTEKWRTQNPAKLESPAQLLARIQSGRQSRYEQQLKKWEAAGSGSKPKKPAPLEPFPAQELVGDFPLPSEWLVLSYGDLCSVIRNGISQKPSGDTGHKIARISAVRPMVFDYEDYRFIDCDDDTAADYMLATGDLIFTRYNGARRFVGVCAQFKGQEPRLYPDKLIRTRPDLPLLDPRYLEIALNCGLSRAWLETKIRTTAGQSGVSGGDVKAMPVPLCSLPEQQEIVRLLDEQFEVIERNEREIDAALQRSEALRQAILKKAFTGHLVPQDSSDEPAAQLLARLRTERTIAVNGSSHGRKQSAVL